MIEYVLFTETDDTQELSKIYQEFIKLNDPNNETVFESLQVSDRVPYCLRGYYQFDEEQRKEWLIIKDLFELSKLDPSLVIGVKDDFGNPLVMEIYDLLESSNLKHLDDRVYIHKGNLHMIPSKFKTDSLARIYSRIYGREFDPMEAFPFYIRDINRNQKMNVPHDKAKLLLKIPKNISELDTKLFELSFPRLITLMDSSIQCVILKILDRLSDPELWTKEMVKRQCERLKGLMVKTEQKEPDNTPKLLNLQELKKVPLNYLDTSPLSTEDSSSESSSSDRSSEGTSSYESFDTEDAKDVSEEKSSISDGEIEI